MVIPFSLFSHTYAPCQRSDINKETGMYNGVLDQYSSEPCPVQVLCDVSGQKDKMFVKPFT